MKKSIFLLVILLFSSHNITAQMQQGNWELSASCTFGSFSESIEISSGSYNENYDSDWYDYMILAFRPGYFVLNSLEIEPEILITSLEMYQPSFSLSGNLAYNFDLEKSIIKPFVLIGYGVDNSIPFLSPSVKKAVRETKELDITHINLGAGGKMFLSKSLAVRIEYRYQNYSYKKEYSDYYSSSSTKYNVKFHKILFGLSFFL